MRAMTDFETRLREALATRAGDPVPVGLADGARARLRARRRTTGAAVVAAVVVAAVPIGLSLAGSPRTDPAPPVATDPTSGPTATPPAQPPAGRRVESWRNASVFVPDDWGYGSLSDWCANDGGLDGNRVERPEGAVHDILCSSTAYGVQFFDPAAFDPADSRSDGAVWQFDRSPDQPKTELAFPDGAWLAVDVRGEVGVRVVARDEAMAREVIGSLTTFDQVDANDCAPRLDPGATTDALEVVTGIDGPVSLCRYGADGWLQQSERLSDADSRAALRALAEAPDAGPLAADPCTTDGTEPFFVTVGGQGADGWVHTVVTIGGCAQGIADGAESIHSLTKDVVYWVLSPGWSGGVGGAVPLPDRLRRQPVTDSP